MNDDTLLVSFPALAQASGDIHAALGKMREQLAELDRVAAPLVASWDGAAKDAYLVRQSSWRRAADELATNLEEIRRALDAASDRYAMTERNNTRLFE
jgi:WXG100 family type VII secretion target